jgi:glycosyltransferase involved in cell wall biosynthesis
MISSRVGLGRLSRHEKGCLSVDAVYQSLDRRVSRRLHRKATAFSGVYAYEDGAMTTFREATRIGLPKLYDLPIGYWRAARDILVEEAELQPAWASTLIGNSDSPAKTARKDEELAQADMVYVASTFTLKTLERAPAFQAKVQVIPYGAPAIPKGTILRNLGGPDRPLRVIFVGSLGQRKGLSYLFGACRKLGPAGVELTVIGTLPLEPCPALEHELKQVRWIASCPHAQVLAEMAAHDVFVFPSLFEGFGLVLLEAMAMGLPIIATPNTAAPDLITDGQEGFIVPIRSAEAIAEKLEQLRSDRALIDHLSRQAIARAKAFTWENYGAELAASVAKACHEVR